MPFLAQLILSFCDYFVQYKLYYSILLIRQQYPIYEIFQLNNINQDLFGFAKHFKETINYKFIENILSSSALLNKTSIKLQVKELLNDQVYPLK